MFLSKYPWHALFLKIILLSIVIYWKGEVTQYVVNGKIQKTVSYLSQFFIAFGFYGSEQIL